MISSLSKDSVEFHGSNKTLEKACTYEYDAVPETKIRLPSVDTGVLFLTPAAPENAKYFGQESVFHSNIIDL